CARDGITRMVTRFDVW
nr:immunoglobulin heavy chain junction region [Macaca mulatta]MOW78411.1 immunoglobulin heavy chain junction region [Macaca mulatta]MOW79084.1 immunoglobulin heavy chain junction region [Macaca mulatta]MOW80089.1 immunoglobulin heavy chain junction region [Macaca mulatta]MOW81634.1 immunoglobulin heavy chain junction region [Macaca mulatta]